MKGSGYSVLDDKSTAGNKGGPYCKLVQLSPINDDVHWSKCGSVETERVVVAWYIQLVEVQV